MPRFEDGQAVVARYNGTALVNAIIIAAIVHGISSPSFDSQPNAHKATVPIDFVNTFDHSGISKFLRDYALPYVAFFGNVPHSQALVSESRTP